MANSKLVPKFYQSVIEDVISNLQDVFMEEGIDDQILKDLKQLWENKILHSKAVESLVSENNHQQIILDLQKQNTHQTAQTSTASSVLPAGRNMQNFTTAELSTSATATTLTLPSGISLPIQVPAGVTLQTASGLMYKVNVPVMVTQSTGGQKYFQQPVHHIIHQVTPVTGQTSLLQQSTVSGQAAAVSKPSRDQATTIQQSSSCQVPSHQQLTKNQSFDVVGQSIFQQPGMSTHLYIQQTGAVKQVVFQQHPGMGVQMRPPTIQNQTVGTRTFTQQQQRAPTQPCSLGQVVQEQMAVGQLVTSDLDRVASGQPLTAPNQAPEQKERRVIQQFAPQVNEALLMVAADPEEEHVSPIPQMDGTNDTSSDEEIANLRDVEETDILGIIDVEDLKALEGYDDDSSSDNSLRDSHNEEHHEEVEEDPLNSGDDVSEQEVPDLFETDNVIVCQYDKIHRNKNRWKFYLKDGIMTFNGRDYVFSKAVGDAEW